MNGVWLSAGKRRLGLIVGQASLSRSCQSEEIIVAPTTCRVVVEPEAGGTFKITWGSNGSSCSWWLDEESKGAIDCNGVLPGVNNLPVGVHTVRLRVGSGLDGNSYVCRSQSFTVP